MVIDDVIIYCGTEFVWLWVETSKQSTHVLRFISSSSREWCHVWQPVSFIILAQHHLIQHSSDVTLETDETVKQ